MGLQYVFYKLISYILPTEPLDVQILEKTSTSGEILTKPGIFVTDETDGQLKYTYNSWYLVYNNISTLNIGTI